MSTIDYAFLLSPDLTLQTPLQERDQRHTCTKPSPPLSIFSLSFPASFPSFHEVDFVPICCAPSSLMITYAHLHLLVFAPCSLSHSCPPSLSSLLIIALITGAWNQPHLLSPREKLIDKRFIFHLLLVLSFCLNSVFDSLVVTVTLRLDRQVSEAVQMWCSAGNDTHFIQGKQCLLDIAKGKTLKISCHHLFSVL